MEVKNIRGKMDYIDVYFNNGKVIRILGELLNNGFCAEKSSIQKWKIPFGKQVTATEKKEIIESIILKTKQSHIPITFE